MAQKPRKGSQRWRALALGTDCRAQVNSSNVLPLSRARRLAADA